MFMNCPKCGAPVREEMGYLYGREEPMFTCAKCRETWFRASSEKRADTLARLRSSKAI
jgi:transposase-like protein